MRYKTSDLTHENHRQDSVIGAVASMLDKAQKEGFFKYEFLTDGWGKIVPDSRVRMNIRKLKGKRKFKTKRIDGIMVIKYVD